MVFVPSIVKMTVSSSPAGKSTMNTQRTKSSDSGYATSRDVLAAKPKVMPLDRSHLGRAATAGARKASDLQAKEAREKLEEKEKAKEKLVMEEDNEVDDEDNNDEDNIEQ